LLSCFLYAYDALFVRSKNLYRGRAKTGHAVLENAGPCDPVAMHMDWDCSCPGILKKIIILVFMFQFGLV
jgi:hypothetical protein